MASKNRYIISNELNNMYLAAGPVTLLLQFLVACTWCAVVHCDVVVVHDAQLTLRKTNPTYHRLCQNDTQNHRKPEADPCFVTANCYTAVPKLLSKTFLNCCRNNLKFLSYAFHKSTW